MHELYKTDNRFEKCARNLSSVKHCLKTSVCRIDIRYYAINCSMLMLSYSLDASLTLHHVNNFFSLWAAAYPNQLSLKVKRETK